MTTDKRRDKKEYWEARLKRMNLGADRARPSWLHFGHDVRTLDTDGRNTYKTAVTGESLEENEWPISLL